MAHRKSRSVYNSDIASAVVTMWDNIASFKVTVSEGMVELSNTVLEAAARHARQITPVRQKPYPPSRRRTPGTMRRSIEVHKATDKHPGWLMIESWLWAWLEGVGRKRALDHVRRVKAGDKSLKRFHQMIKTDPRRLLGEPMQKQMNFIRSERRLLKVIEKAVKENEIA